MTENRALRLRRPRAMAPLTADARPRLATGVVFEQSTGEVACIALLHGVPTSRVSRTVVDLLRAMDGESTLGDLHRRFAASQPFEGFVSLVQRFRACGLLEGGAHSPRGRVVYRPPFTLQIATMRAPTIFGGVDRMIGPLSRRMVLIPIAVLLSLGLVASALQASELLDVLAEPAPIAGLVCLVIVLSLLTLLHESAHGVALTRFGGRPRRAGVMLFYLTPAFFVDVTDGWRLPDRGHRVAIALAGPAVHAVTGAVAATAALVVRQPAVHQTLLLLALSCAGIVVINLIPFVRFDGYIALMSALDEPNLRARSIRDGADHLTRLLFGGPRKSRSVNTWWSVPFGLASLITPMVLVLFAVDRISRALAGGGQVLGLLVVCLEATVFTVGIVFIARALHRVLRSGVSVLRFTAVCLALASGIAVAGGTISVPVSATFGFTTQADGIVLVHAGETVGTTVPDGAHVVLMTNGILVNMPVGEGIVHARRSEPTTIPLDAILPVDADGARVPAVIVAGVAPSDETEDLPATGQARVELGTRSLWQTIWTSAVLSPLSIARGEK
nr:daptide biosynthesis intramembrane metalloprotease [Microbacterium hydrocarbonoxydans]